MSQPISNDLWYSNLEPTTRSASSNVLGKDDFLKILITQLQNQDPANPMDDREFIAQMAQFSSLEQMTNMNQNISQMMDMQITQNLVTHSELIGKEIQWMQLIDNEDGHRPEVQYLENKVQSVKIESDGSIRLLLDNNTWISNYQLVQVEPVKNGTDDTQGEQKE
ncbi:flagellar hook assembly protein FlgD [Alkalihalobacillus trypoxylicola]|uniref:Flagellar biosynthesis protein FlgD n=1 Tax=Alkalihalobacillus trypoxylicola TaxID=519424 RepID=A0A161PM26_9BACI|nr:flagellar hook assembly protein FlgD [Alkalihalobacillus trypoxylicola]KYG35053.1 flagellar biosynthesis protein FlgD [Alkalihalobacillus trypoxylicola]